MKAKHGDIIRWGKNTRSYYLVFRVQRGGGGGVALYTFQGSAVLDFTLLDKHDEYYKVVCNISGALEKLKDKLDGTS